MRVLLDTHVFLWSVSDPARLSRPLYRMIQDAVEIYVSAASMWEISIKKRLGRIDAEPARLIESITESGFRGLPIGFAHAARVEALPDHHRDPFDRLLIAQAITEPLILLTCDRLLAKYGDFVRTF